MASFLGTPLEISYKYFYFGTFGTFGTLDSRQHCRFCYTPLRLLEIYIVKGVASFCFRMHLSDVLSVSRIFRSNRSGSPRSTIIDLIGGQYVMMNS